VSDFDGKAVLVTGAATGIGEAIARRLFAGGASLALIGHDPAGLARVAGELDSRRERTFFLEADVRDEAAMAGAVGQTVGRFGSLDAAVNNAGVTGPAETFVHALALEDWKAVIDTDLTGMFVSMKAEIAAMIDRGGGAILNLSSANGQVGLAGLSAYTAAKHGVVGLTRSAALEYADRNIRVNCIGPGYVATERMLATPEPVLAAMAASHPVGRLATPEEVAEFAAFLLSDKASFCTGGFYPIDGGYTAR
jgi:NAD(P)-dependent dehydrogenase (short-subunit alcohol dehydrogenase family)